MDIASRLRTGKTLEVQSEMKIVFEANRVCPEKHLPVGGIASTQLNPL
jgi:hypothetical protein